MAILISSANSANPDINLSNVFSTMKTGGATEPSYGIRFNGPEGQIIGNWNYETSAQRDTDWASLRAANDPIGTRPYVVSHSEIATDAEIAAVAGTAYHLPDNVLTEARDIVIPEGTDGDVMEFYNNETAFDWSFAGEAVLDAAGAAITALTDDTIYVVRFVGGAWRAY